MSYSHNYLPLASNACGERTIMCESEELEQQGFELEEKNSDDSKKSSDQEKIAAENASQQPKGVPRSTEEIGSVWKDLGCN